VNVFEGLINEVTPLRFLKITLFVVLKFELIILLKASVFICIIIVYFKIMR